MEQGDQKRQLIDEQTEGTGRLRSGVERARLAVERARSRDGEGMARARDGGERVRLAVEDAGWFLREHVAWPVEDSLDRLGRRGTIGVFGGGGIAVAGVVAALVIAGSGGGSGSSAPTTEAFVTPQRAPATPAPKVVAPAPKPKPKVAKPSGPTLHGAAPDFAPAQDVRSGVGAGKAVSTKPSTDASDAEGPAKRGTASESAPGATAPDEAITSSNDNPASTAKIGATPAATAQAEAQASSLKESGAGIAETAQEAEEAGGEAAKLTGPPAPKAAKQVARRFAEAFVVYEVGGVDGHVRKAFKQTSTRQLSRSLLQRPPRQPANVKVPEAKVVNVVAGPSKGNLYTLSVSLLRVGVTSELRIQMEQGVGKKWQVTNVFG
jgi:hypothetical protein